jgi:hypothetical protein
MKKQILDPNYVTRLVDGEGCFCISFSPRKFQNVDWEVRPSFSISQNKKERGILFKLKEFFGCGFVRISRKDNTYKYEVRSINELQKKIIPHFKKYPLKTEKRKDFEILTKVVEMMKEEKHLRNEGLKEIAELVERMSKKSKRIYELKRFSELTKV